MNMRKQILLKGLLVAAFLPLLAGCVTYEQPASPGNAVVVAQPENPPPPQEQAMPTPPGSLELWVWIPGCWDWRGHWVWVAGRWAPRPHPHAVWMAGHWQPHERGYVWVSGRWR